MTNRRRFGSVRRLPSGRFQVRYIGPDDQRVNGNRILTIWRQLNIDQLIGHFGSLVSRLVRPPVCWRGSFSVVPALRRR